jgi:hypothetical protein
VRPRLCAPQYPTPAATWTPRTPWAGTTGCATRHCPKAGTKRRRATHLNNLGNALRTLFERTGQQGVLAEAVTVALQAVAAIPEGHSDRAGRLNSLGNAVLTLFEYTGEQGVLAEAVEALRAAVAATPEDSPDRAMYLSNLGGTLRVLFGHTGEQGALVEAVAVWNAPAEFWPPTPSACAATT